MPRAPITPAPRWRTLLAGLLDGALLAGLAWIFRNRVRGRAGAAALALLGSLGEFAREQLASPGQRLLGVRTVDRRTGARTELWRTGLLLGATAAGQQLTMRLQPQSDPEAERARETFLTEMGAIHERHPIASTERQAESQALYTRYTHAVYGPDILRGLGVSLAVSLLNRRLRRRLAPTVEVLARRRADHSP